MKKHTLIAAALLISIPLFSQDKDFSLAKVGKKIMGVYIFIGCEPANEYDYIASLDFKPDERNMEKSLLEVIEKGKKKYPNFNAIIIFKNFKFEKVDLIKFRDLELSGGGFRIGDYAVYNDYGKPLYVEIAQLDNPKQRAGFKYFDDYGEEKISTTAYSKLSPISKEQYDKLREQQKSDLQKHQFVTGQKVSFIIDKISRCGEVVNLNNRNHNATIKYLGIYADDKTIEVDYLGVDKISEEKYLEDIAKCKKEALQYKFEVGEKVVWKKETLLGMKSEAINAEIISLNDLEHKATVKFTNKDNAEKQETVSYLNLSKIK